MYITGSKGWLTVFKLGWTHGHFPCCLSPHLPPIPNNLFGTFKSQESQVSRISTLKFQIPFPPSVGGFNSKSTSKKYEDKKASRRSEEVKSQVILCQSLIFVGRKFNSFLKAGNHSRCKQAVAVVEEEDVDVTGQLHQAYVAFATGIHLKI